MIDRSTNRDDGRSDATRASAGARHSLHVMDPQIARNVVMFTPSVPELEPLLGAWQGTVGTSATREALRAVMSSNPGAIQAFARRSSFDWSRPKAEGFMAILPLSDAGHEALLDGSFVPNAPAPEHLVGQHQQARSIYFASIYTPGALAGSVALAFEYVSGPLRREADLFSRAATPEGRRLVEGIGFVPLPPGPDVAVTDLFVFRRKPEAPPRPVYDTYPSATERHTITVVRNWEDLAKAMSVRSAVYVAEQACPYEEEFDGNDFSSTHLLGFAGAEAVATIRVRCFAEFAKIERLAVRREHRNPRLSFLIVKAAFELCRVKGYTRIYGHARMPLVPFWARATGARVLDGARQVVFSDFEHIEMLAEPLPHPEAISLRADPLTIIRPEGRWHVPGVLDRSGARPVTQPSLGWDRASEQAGKRVRRQDTGSDAHS